MAKYAIRHKDGILVGSLGPYFVNFAGDFKGAMTFSDKKTAQEMADYINSQTAKNGARKGFYSVCEKSQYKKPAFLKKKKCK